MATWPDWAIMALVGAVAGLIGGVLAGAARFDDATTRVITVDGASATVAK